MERYGNVFGRIPPPGQAPLDPLAWIKEEQERRIRVLQLRELQARAAVATAEQQAAGEQKAATVQGKARLSPRELADKHGVHAASLRKRLDRWRYEHDAGFVEVSNAARNEPRYLYDESAVMPVIEALKAKPVGRKRAADGQRKII